MIIALLISPTFLNYAKLRAQPLYLIWPIVKVIGYLHYEASVLSNVYPLLMFYIIKEWNYQKLCLGSHGTKLTRCWCDHVKLRHRPKTNIGMSPSDGRISIVNCLTGNLPQT